MSTPRLSPFAFRLLAGAVALALIAGATVFSARRADRQLRANLLLQARLVAHAVDLDVVQTLAGTAADLDAPGYWRIKSQLASIVQANPKCKWFYLMGRKADGTIFFFVDSEAPDAEDPSPPGQTYEEASEGCRLIFDDQNAMVEGPIPDRWGVWVSALVPMIDPKTGTVAAVLGMDIEAGNWKRDVAFRAALPTVLAAIAVLLGLAAVLLQQSRRKLRAGQTDLRESEERYTQLAEQSRTVVWEVDAAGLYTYVNPAAELVLGYRPDELVNRLHFYDLHPEEGREAFKQKAFEIFRSKELFDNLENRARAKDGRTVWLCTNGLPIVDGRGGLRGYRGSDRDITERKRAEEALRNSEERLGALFESMGEMTVLHELIFDENGRAIDYRLTDCNPTFTRITGIPRDQAVGRSATEVYRAETAPFLDEYARVAQTGVPHRFETHYAPMDKYFSISVVPLGANQFATLSTDITERRRAEEQVRALLEESNRARLALLGIIEDEARAKADLKRLATAIEQSAESIVVTDAQGIIQYVNPAFEAVTGYTRAEALGQNPRILQSGRHDAAFYRKMWDALAGGKTWQGRFVNKRKSGSLYTEDAVISPVCDADGKIVNFVAVKRNITEHLRLAEQLQQAQRMESVGRLAGGVAHDFNNMLTVILGRTEFALEQTAPGLPVRADLKEIREAALRATDITRQLLAFARKQTVAPRVLDLNRTIEGMLQMLRRLIGEDIDLAWKPKPDLWPVKVDPSQIDQILANLCVNARDAIAGVGKIAIETGHSAFDVEYCADHADFLPGQFVWLAVGDTGCGMDRETLAHIFEPFFTTKEAGEGTGLGLATVYGIVRQNNGFIHSYSEPGQGTLFKIYLPRHAEPGEPKPANGPELPAARGRETILLAEDDPLILKMTASLLERQGYTVLAANTPGEAVRLAGQHAGRIHLLMTDVVMPEMNGRTLAQKLVAADPKLKLLFMSGYTADVIAHNGVLEDGVNFIQKPFSRQDLSVKLREVLGT